MYMCVCVCVCVRVCVHMRVCAMKFLGCGGCMYTCTRCLDLGAYLTFSMDCNNYQCLVLVKLYCDDPHLLTHLLGTVYQLWW